MATFHITAEPVPGQDPDPRTRPLVPQDYMAESEADAVAFGETIVAEDAHHRWEFAHAGIGGSDPEDEPGADWTGDTTVTDQAVAYVGQWRVVARCVERPAVDLLPHGAVDPVIRNGQVVRYAHPVASPESYDMLLDGVPSGHLRRAPDEVSGHPAWRIGDAAGPLVQLADRRWNDYSDGYALGTEQWLDGVLSDIRQALEREN